MRETYAVEAVEYVYTIKLYRFRIANKKTKYYIRRTVCDIHTDTHTPHPTPTPLPYIHTHALFTHLHPCEKVMELIFRTKFQPYIFCSLFQFSYMPYVR